MGAQGVRRFYSEHFINQTPKDAKVTPISRTIGKDQVVDELIVSFTHDTQWDYLLPGIPPTGKHVELPHVVVMKFENGKVRTSTSGGTRPHCSCKWDCWIRRNCQSRASSRPETCCALHTNTGISQPSRQSVEGASGHGHVSERVVDVRDSGGGNVGPNYEEEISMDTEQNKQVVKEVYAAFGRGDIPAVRALVAEEVIWHLPGTVPHYSGTYKGPSSVADFFQNLYANVGIEAFEPREFVAEADRVLVIDWSRGRVKSTGHMFNNRWVMTFIVRDGRIAKFEEYAETQALAAAHEASSRGAAMLSNRSTGSEE